MKLYILDISSFIFRAFFAIRSLTSPKGVPTNAVYGVASMLAKLIEEAKPSHMVVTYDSKEPSFRKEIFDDYKANRSDAPEDLVPQFDLIEELIRVMGIASIRKSGIEADDLIATLTKDWLKKSPKNDVMIVTGDKDLMQLVNSRVRVWDTMKEKVFDEPAVLEKFGIKPDQVRDYLALIGDASDNIPGVPSIGPKSAVDLLKEFNTLEGVLKAAQAGKIKGKKGEVLVSHVKDAKLSQELATLKDDVKITYDPSDFEYSFKVTGECIEFLKELNFKGIVEKWSKQASNLSANGKNEKPSGNVSLTADSSKAKKHGPFEFVSIQDEDALQKLINSIKKYKKFGFDLETTSLNPREAEIVGIALSIDSQTGYYIPVGHSTSEKQIPKKRVLELLKPILEDSSYGKVGQNLKYDWSVCLCQGIEIKGMVGDTMVASYLVDPLGRHNLGTIAKKYIDYEPLSFEDVTQKGQMGFDQVNVAEATRYSAEDAVCAFKLWETLHPLLKKESVLDIYERIELPLVEVLSRLECAGVRLDLKWLKELSGKFQKEIERISERVSAHTSAPINLNSPKQLSQLLFSELKLPPQGKTKSGFSTDASVLEVLAPMHEVPRLLLEYREYAKLKGTYVDPLPLMVDAKTGRVHGSFHQTGTATGRLSSSDPNLQNIPIRTDKGKLIRRAFIPSEGNVLLSADYSQIELRILAHMSEDPDLVQSFVKDEDVHRRTASEIFEIKPEAVNDEQRSVAKAINFGLMYGKTAFGLAQELHISRTEAKKVIDRYFARYAAVKRFLDQLIVTAKETGRTTTLLGRHRPLPDIKSSNPAIRANAERMAMNTPIQGTAADLMKLAMIEVDHQLIKEKLKSKIIIQVHDELVLDCPQKEVARVEELVRSIMENALKLRVPLKVNAVTGSNWAEL